MVLHQSLTLQHRIAGLGLVESMKIIRGGCDLGYCYGCTHKGYPKNGYETVACEVCHGKTHAEARISFTAGGSESLDVSFHIIAINPDTKLLQRCTYKERVRYHGNRYWSAEPGYRAVVLPAKNFAGCKSTQEKHVVPLGDTCISNFEKVINSCIMGKLDDVGGF
jgi:hypothetical protein